MWGLRGCHQLPTLLIERGSRHGYLLLESREINLLSPQSDQVIFRIQERVPVTSFEDGVRGPEVTHHLHRAGIPSDGIYQRAVVVLQLQYSGKQTVVILHPAWYDEVTPCIFSAQLGISVTELQGGSAYTMVQAHPCGTVLSVKVIGLSALDVCCGIHQTIGRVRWDRHNTAEIIHEEAIGAPLAGIASSLESAVHLPEVDIYVLDEVVDLVGAVEAAINSADHESHVNIDNSLVLAVCMLDCGDVNVPSERRVHRPSREIYCMQRVRSMGQKWISPRLIPSWQRSVLCGMVPPPFSIMRMHPKLRATI